MHARSSRSRLAAATGFCALFALATELAASLGCHGPAKQQPAPSATSATSAKPTARAQSTATAAATDAGAALDAAVAKREGPYLGAIYPATPVFSEMEWPEKDGHKSKSVRVGYLRQGSKAPVKADSRTVKPNCTEGWYELEAGGYVCGKYATLDLNHPKFRLSAHVPFDDRPLPYEYGYNVANGTPLYRVVPSREERAANEPWLSAKKAPRKPREEAEATDDDGGAPPALAEHAEGEQPWYLREYDGGKPQVTLQDLQGEGPVARRMVKGFFLALDRRFGSGGASWYRTTSGLIAPADRIMAWKSPTDFKGIWLDERGIDGSKPPAQIGFVLGPRAKRYDIIGKRAAVAGDAARFTSVRLTSNVQTLGGLTYVETEAGYWLRLGESTKTEPGPVPTDLAPNEKWVDVNLTRQTLVLFEGSKAVYATLVSSGRRSPVHDKDHPTPTGSFRIREKHVASTMDGDVASDGPYSIEDVPWVMYFQGSYALHGAFWHGNFGHMQSHGCVNLSPNDAKAIFGWTEPQVPEGWHGTVATLAHPGTRVVVHD